MSRISRIAGLYAQSFAQDASSSVIEPYQDDEVGDSVTMDEDDDLALDPISPATGAPGSRRELSEKRRRDPSQPLKKLSSNDPRVRLIQSQCLKMSLGLFNRPQRHTRSLGFTSAIPGEGKTFLATVTATTIAERTHRPVTLLDCNWDHPDLHRRFGIANSPGLAEWLRRECDLADIRRTVSPWLTVIPCGDASHETLALAQRFQALGAQALLTLPDELLVVDLPSVLITDYGALLPQTLDSVLLVVHAGVTQEAYITEAARELSDSALEGTVLNATHSSIPRWLLRLL